MPAKKSTAPAAAQSRSVPSPSTAARASADIPALVERLIREARENSTGDVQLTRETLAETLRLILAATLESCDYDAHLAGPPQYIARCLAGVILRVEQMPAFTATPASWSEAVQAALDGMVDVSSLILTVHDALSDTNAEPQTSLRIADRLLTDVHDTLERRATQWPEPDGADRAKLRQEALAALEAEESQP